MENLYYALTLAGMTIFGIVLIFLLLTRLYRKANKETAYVRTGVGGSRVIIDGGALILPVFHELVPVSLRTHKLVVRRAQSEALITNDNLRADVTVDFYVRVQREASAIEIAAQTLGDRTNDPEALMELVEGKFVDALRSVAAGMKLQDLHLHRADFVQKVREAVNEDLHKNGLELESASLVGLDQTDRKYFNPENTFDASGLAIITAITEEKRRERFAIEANANVAIAERDRDQTMAKLEIQRTTEQAKLDQERDIAGRRASTQAEVASKEAEADRSSKEARIEAERSVKQRVIESNTAIRLREQETEAEIAKRSELVSAAEAAAAEARARAVAAEEQVETARSVEIANRAKQVTLVQAEEQGRRDALHVTIAAEAEREAAEARARAITTEAKAAADAAMLRAEAQAREYEVEAAGTEAVNVARNKLDARLIELDLRVRIVEGLPAILAAATKPMEKIDSIKIVDVSGLGQSNGRGEFSDVDGGGNQGGLAQQVVSAALRHRVQAPILDELMAQVGIRGAESLQGILSGIQSTSSPNKTSASQVSPPSHLPAVAE